MIGAGLHGCFRLFKRGFFRVDEYGGLCYPGRVRGRSRKAGDGLTGSFAPVSRPSFCLFLMSVVIGGRGER